MAAPERRPPAPAVLRLVQMAVLGRWRETAEDLYREVAGLLEAAPGREVIVAGCGEGITTEWLAERTGASITGVDPDAEQVAHAEQRARATTASQTLTYTQASLDDLPYETNVFDAGVGEPTLSAADDPARAVAELVRVTKPMGAVVLLELTWSSEIASSARELLVERLGLRPHLLVEWKQMMRDAGAVDIQVQDWTSGGPGGPARPSGSVRAVDEPRELTWQEKAQIAGRALRSAGWREARRAVEREEALLRALARERAIGFQLIKGVKWPHAIG